jgi:hypothetical protein
VFYINLPIGAVALAIVATALPTRQVHAKHSIDYLGAAVLGAGVSALILALSWGGVTYGWTSHVILGLLVFSLVMLVLFVVIELRATEPIIPMTLFRSPIFRVASAAGGIVGLAMFGAITFLPLFLQAVMGSGPTKSGLQMVPIMALVLTTSIWSGRRISATGRYRRFPIAGTIIVTLGIYLLSHLGIGTPYWKAAIYMAIVGAGMGMTMQVMILAVQNSVSFKELGTATSAVTFFRSIGGSIGVAVFGTIFANRLVASLPAAMRSAGAGATHLTPKQLRTLPPRVHADYVQAFAHSLHIVYLSAVPFAALGIVLALMLREVPLRPTTGRSVGMDAAEGQSMPLSAENAEIMSGESPAAVR